MLFSGRSAFRGIGSRSQAVHVRRSNGFWRLNWEWENIVGWLETLRVLASRNEISKMMLKRYGS